MRYENILQIYWSKGFFFSGQLFYFDKSFSDIFQYLTGFNKYFLKKITQRFELTYFFKKTPYITLTDYKKINSRVIMTPLNIIFSQITTVNNKWNELYRLNIIRLYLIKSYRGRCHALGKPVRGQRTWSNAWNAYNVNKTLRLYISETNTQLKSQLKIEKINYKVVKKKYAVKKQ